MSKFNLDPQLDSALKTSIANPGSFLEDLDFVYSLLSFKIIAPEPLFSVEMSERSILPVFTDESAWEVFTANLNNPAEDMEWLAQSAVDVLNKAAQYKIDTLGFNLRAANEQKADNMVYFGKDEFIAFIQKYNDLMTELTGEENQNADKFHKLYLVPSFLFQKEEDKSLMNVFPVLTSEKEKNYIPVFDNIQSFVNWYFNPDFSKEFREEDGQVLPMYLNDFINPTDGVSNRIEDSDGLVINPMDVTEENFDKAVVDWDSLKAELDK